MRSRRPASGWSDEPVPAADCFRVDSSRVDSFRVDSFREAVESGDVDESGHVLEFTCHVGDRALQGVDILRGSDDELTELTVLVRPYSATTALRERMAAMLT